MSEFKNYLQKEYDYELLVSLKDLINELEQKYEALNSKLQSIERYVYSLRETSNNRKEMAEMIKIEFSPLWQKVAFRFLSNKPNFKFEDLMLEMEE